MPRRVVFATLTGLAAIGAWVVYWAGAWTIVCAVAAKRIHPAHRWGNCWLHALDLWARRGGSLVVRRADGLEWGPLFVPHVAWAESLGADAIIEQYTTDAPLPEFALSGIWFRGVIKRTDRAGHVTPGVKPV